MATILVVDDRPSNRLFLTTLLGYGGHRMLEAEDGEGALGAVRAEHPALVITDILMPKMDGYEFIQRMRAEPEIAATPVIIYTATYSTPQAEALARSCGVRTVLPKPCEPQAMLAAVNRELGVSGPGASAPPGSAIPPGAARVQDDTLNLFLGELEEVKQRFEELAAQSPKLQVRRDAVKELSRKFAENIASMQRVTARVSALLEVGMELMSERDPKRLVELFFAASCDLVDSKYAAVGMLDESEQAISIVFAKGIDAETLRGDVGRVGLLGSLLSGHRAMRMRSEPSASGREGLPAGHPEVRDLLGVPVASPDRVYGWMYFADKRGEDGFNEEDTRLVNAMTRKLALLYENAMLYDVIQRHAAQLQIEMGERKRAEAELQTSEARFRAMFEKAAVGITQTDLAGRFVSANPKLCEMLGCAADEVQSLSFQALTHPDDVQGSIENRARMVAGATAPYGRDARVIRRDGSQIWVHTTTALVRAADGKPLHFISVVHDISDRKEAETRIRRLNRVHAVLSGINAVIVRVRDREELFREACRIAVEDGGFLTAWLGVVDRAALQVTPVAWNGIGADYIERMPIGISGGTLAEMGLPGVVVNERKPVVVDDMTQDPRIKLRSEAGAHGFHSLAMLPLLVGADVVGVLALYAHEIGFFDEEEMKLLHELASDIGFALDHLEKAKRLDYLAYYDVLTGLANRTHFHDRLGQFVDAAARGVEKLAVMVLDLDRFRSINDSLGRDAGDDLLKQVAQRMRQAASDPDSIARIGADRFAIVRPEVASESEVARHNQRKLEECFGTPFRIGETDLRIAAKVGIAIYPTDGADAETLFRNAEAALKKAKATGERTLFYAQEMTERVAEKLGLETRLRQALEKEEFVLHYQPKVDVMSRAIVGVEALIRWQSAEGLVPPAKFISLLEETGLIREVGTWALRRAVLDHRHWLRMGIAAPRVAVNVSAIQLRQKDFVAVVQEVIAQGANPTGLDLEITESLLMDDLEGNIRKLKAIHEMGINIAIDDFGTGYSSLGYLAKLPVQALKIDRGFVVAMLQDPSATTLVQTIISLGNSLHLKVVAEGVETEEQAKMLKLLRCNELQGYLISKPLPIEELIPLLREAGRRF